MNAVTCKEYSILNAMVAVFRFAHASHVNPLFIPNVAVSYSGLQNTVPHASTEYPRTCFKSNTDNFTFMNCVHVTALHPPSFIVLHHPQLFTGSPPLAPEPFSSPLPPSWALASPSPSLEVLPSAASEVPLALPLAWSLLSWPPRPCLLRNTSTPTRRR